MSEEPITITVLSGKGGTGKTTLAVALAPAVPGARLLDCDVEEPDAHLFLDVRPGGRREVRVLLPKVREEACDGCAGLPAPRCREACEYRALAVVSGRVLLFPGLCHSCGACIELCPREVFAEGRKVVGEVTWGSFGDDRAFVMGRLRIGEPSAVPVIRAVKERIDPSRVSVLDAPPGVACPVVESLRGADAALLVTEPTPFGRHDVGLAADLCRDLGVPAGVLLNRADLGDAGTEAFCADRGLPILGRIPFDREVARALARGGTLLDARPGEAGKLRELVGELRRLAAGRRASA